MMAYSINKVVINRKPLNSLSYKITDFLGRLEMALSFKGERLGMFIKDLFFYLLTIGENSHKLLMMMLRGNLN